MSANLTSKTHSKFLGLCKHTHLSRYITCLCSDAHLTGSRLVRARVQIQANGEGLSSPYDQPIRAVQLRVVVRVIELTGQIPGADV